jgi:hypothetical protein
MRLAMQAKTTSQVPRNPGLGVADSGASLAGMAPVRQITLLAAWPPSGISNRAAASVSTSAVDFWKSAADG